MPTTSDYEWAGFSERNPEPSKFVSARILCRGDSTSLLAPAGDRKLMVGNRINLGFVADIWDSVVPFYTTFDFHGPRFFNRLSVTSSNADVFPEDFLVLP